MTYIPPRVVVDDAYNKLSAWVDDDRDPDNAAHALATNPNLRSLSRETRTAVLARFHDEWQPVAGKDFLPTVTEGQADTDALERIREGLRAS
jgi:hypothetical protein